MANAAPPAFLAYFYQTAVFRADWLVRGFEDFEALSREEGEPLPEPFPGLFGPVALPLGLEAVLIATEAKAPALSGDVFASWKTFFEEAEVNDIILEKARAELPAGAASPAFYFYAQQPEDRFFQAIRYAPERYAHRVINGVRGEWAEEKSPGDIREKLTRFSVDPTPYQNPFGIWTNKAGYEEAIAFQQAEYDPARWLYKEIGLDLDWLFPLFQGSGDTLQQLR